jgi:hypothetical protein
MEYGVRSREWEYRRLSYSPRARTAPLPTPYSLLHTPYSQLNGGELCPLSMYASKARSSAGAESG